MLTDSSLLEVDLGQGVYAAFTTRVGGQSTGRYEGLNLSTATGDSEHNVTRHWDALAVQCGAPLHRMKQVHGSAVAEISTPDQMPEADGLLACVGGQAVAVLVADCVPVLLADEAGGVVAAVHAGRAGVLSQIVPRAVEKMTEQGALPSRIVAGVGPAICGKCYEVPEFMHEEAQSRLPVIGSRTSWGTPALDLPAAVKKQLDDSGVSEIRHLDYCTLEDRRFYSHRRGQPTGRQAGLVMLRDV